MEMENVRSWYRPSSTRSMTPHHDVTSWRRPVA